MLEGSDLLILAVIVLVLFGGSQLPKLARNLGKAQSEFKSALDDSRKEVAADGPVPDRDESSAGRD